MNYSEIEIEPSVFRWARETLKMDLRTAAERLDTDIEVIKAIEEGKYGPVPGKFLEKAARIFRRPFAVFLLKKVPEETEDLPYFRKSGKDYIPEEFIISIRRAHVIRRDIIELSELGEKIIPPFDGGLLGKIRLPNNSEELVRTAAEIREKLGISDFYGNDIRYSDLLGNLKKRIEKLGIPVMEIDGFGTEIFRGFCIAERPYPLIALNYSDVYSGKIFSLVHEFIHILTGESGICTDSPTTPDIRKTERICNELTAETLIPLKEVLKHPVVRNHPTDKPWTADEIGKIAIYFNVSPDTVLITLKKAGIFREMHNNISGVSGTIRGSFLYKLKKYNRPERKDRISRLIECLPDLLIYGVFSAYNEGNINFYEIMEYLDISFEDCEELMERLGIDS